MDLPVDLSRLLYDELFCYQQQLDGLNCRVPTKTTPTITPVTPTTLRNFEQTILDYQAETESHQNEAGFVPPLVQTIAPSLNSSINVIAPTSMPDNAGRGGNLYVNVSSWQGGGHTELPPLISLNTNTLSPPIPTHVASMESFSSSSSSSSSSSRSRRNTGGRRPNKENGSTPEEQQKKLVRRERNKIAAAKCRKKRVELIHNLEQTVRELEGKRDDLSQQNQMLQLEMEDLRSIWESHLPGCRIRDTDSPIDVKPYHLAAGGESHQHQHQLELHEQKPPLSAVVVADDSTSSRIYASPMCGDGQLIIPDRIVAMDTSTTTVLTCVSSSSNISHNNHNNNNNNGNGIAGTMSKPRPNCLPLPTSCSAASYPTSSAASAAGCLKPRIGTMADITGIQLTTPSTEFLDSLMIESGTGLTPISTSSATIVPSCSTQLRSSSCNMVDLSSPDSIPNKLVSL